MLGTAATIGIGLGLAGVGSALKARSQNKAATQQTQYNQQQASQLRAMQQQQPGAAENAIAAQLAGLAPTTVNAPGTVTAGQLQEVGFTPQMFSGGFDPTTVTSGYSAGQINAGQVSADQNALRLISAGYDPKEITAQEVAAREWGGYDIGEADVGGALSQYGFNSGQDAILQALRADPRTKVDETLTALMTQQGDPFDTTELFDALAVADAERQAEALGQFQGSFAGLGQRFGTHAQREQGRLQRGLANDASLRNAQISMQAYEAGMGRAMQSAEMLTGREQFGQQFQLAGGAQLQQGATAATGQVLTGVRDTNQALAQRGGLELQANQQQLEAAISNQAANLQAQGMNAQEARAAAEMQLRAEMSNQQASLQMGAMGLEAQIANQAANLQAAGMNEQNALNAARLQVETQQINNSMQLASQQLNLQGVQVNNQAMQAAAELVQRGDIAQMQADLQAAGMNQAAQLEVERLAIAAKQGDQQAQAQLLQLLSQAEQARQQNNTALQIASAQTGSPVAGPGYGGVIGDLGTAVLFGGQMLGQPAGGGGGGGSESADSAVARGRF